MGSFVFFAALLGLIAIAFAIATLWQRSRGLAVGLALALPLVAGGVYYLKGQPAALDPANVRAPTTVEEAVAQLQHRLADEPETFENLVVLARSFMATEKFVEARDTYARALKLKPDDLDVPVEYAESLLRTSADHRFPPQAVGLLERAVEKSPQNQRALFFLGMQRFQSDKPAEAAAIWEKLLPLLQPDAAAALRSQIDSARAAAGLANLPQAVAADALVKVEVSIDGVLAGQVRPGDVLFVYARTLEGVGPPLAAKRIVLGRLPQVINLGDADSPMPTAKLSSQPEVVVMARLSRSGDANSASGDIEADPVTVSTKPGSSASVVLNRTVP
ncbi:MAG: cytochrome C biogenesis protein [Frankiaceae bacterium]|nr:cytochrome C biogenesis protein [Arenimonas sp.]